MISIPKGKKPLHRRWFALAFLLRCFEHDFLKKFRDTVVVTGWQVRRSSCCAKLNFRACSLHASGECRLRSHAFSLARMFLRRGTVPSLDAKGCNMPYPFLFVPSLFDTAYILTLVLTQFSFFTVLRPYRGETEAECNSLITEIL